MSDSIMKDDHFIFIQALAKRIESLLPNHTGRSIEEVELDQQFSITRKLLLENNSKDPRTVTYILVTFASILKTINTEFTNNKLKYRDDKSRNSILLICKLLADVLKVSWDRESTIVDDKDFLSNYSKFYYYDTPNRIESSVVSDLVDTFVNMISSSVVRKVVSLVRNEQTLTTLIVAKEESEILREDQLMTKEEETELVIGKIDFYLDTIIRYIATANPEDYYDVLKAKIFRYSQRDATIPLPVLQTYLPLLKFIFFAKVNSVTIVDDTLKALPCIRSNTWKQVYLHFLASSIKAQSFSRTLDYNVLVDLNDTHQTQVARSLFDISFSLFSDESSTNSFNSPFVLIWFFVICLEDVIEVSSDKPLNKLKLTFNKRLKFIMSQLKESSNASSLGSFDSFIHLFHLGARLQAYNQLWHPIYKFSMKFLDEIHQNLIKFGEVRKDDLLVDDDLLFRYDLLTVNFYLAAILINPDKYIRIVINNYKQNQEDLRFNKIFVKIIKGLSEIQTAKKSFFATMKQVTPTLRLMVYGASKILYQYEIRRSINQISQGSINGSSDASTASYIDNEQNSDEVTAATQEAFSRIKTSLDHYTADLFDTDLKKLNSSKNFTTSSSSVLSTSTYRFRVVNGAEELLSDIFRIFAAAPEFYFNDEKLMSKEVYETKPLSESLPPIIRFCHDAIIPIRLAFKSKWIIQGDTRLLDSTKELSLKMVEPTTSLIDIRTDLSVFANFQICCCIIYVTCEACLSISLLNPKFKSCFLFLNSFLQKRTYFNKFVIENPILTNPDTRVYLGFCGDIIHSVEKVLLLSLCTHDISFYNYALQGIDWYLDEVETNKPFYPSEDVRDTLIDTFQKISEDKAVFTGFVSLHKRHRNILRNSKPTKSLYQTWVTIYHRWVRILDTKSSLGNDKTLILRHFTGFLVSTSGCFLSGSLVSEELAANTWPTAPISEFFDKCIELLTSPDMVIQMIIKEALASESQAEVYCLTARKLMETATHYFENNKSDEIAVFLDRAIIVMTSMINVKSEGALYLSTLLPEICQDFIKFINAIDDPCERFKLQLRFCKLGCALESDRTNAGLNGAYKLRNLYSRASLEWLEPAVFYDSALEENIKADDSSSVKTNKEVELSHLALDFAVECSILLRGQVENLLLEVPDGIKEDEINKYKDLSFSVYFSLFYKVIQKYTKATPTNREKHKHHIIIDNILQSITNILQYDSQIGMRFILPMGYHESKKIRSIFLNVFSKMLVHQSKISNREEYPDKLINELTDQFEIFGSIAECASSFEHNLLASAFFEVFSYTGKLNNLFNVLLNTEVALSSRSTDLFRRNSTLTKFLSFYAQTNGVDYLNEVLLPVIKELVDNDVQFEVEKQDNSDTADLFILYLSRIIDSIVNSTDKLPHAFKSVSKAIYDSVSNKFPEAALTAVSSFVFLRFLCPAIISPEQHFKLPINNPKVKRSLMQLVKVLQNMANGTLTSIKWPAIAGKTEELNFYNQKIDGFLKIISTDVTTENQSAESYKPEKPLTSLRYLHKFIYHYFAKIRYNFLFQHSWRCNYSLHDKAVKFKKFDYLVMQMGQPNPGVKLQMSSKLKLLDTNNLDEEEIKLNDFMTKMSIKFSDTPPDAIDVIHSSIFKDGTPAVVVNLKKLSGRPHDFEYLAYKLIETASQVWDNKFYLVYDFTEYYYYIETVTIEYANLIANSGTKLLFSNCQRVYYFNIPRIENPGIMEGVKLVRSKGEKYGTKVYIYSLADPDSIIKNLCLDSETLAINRENKVTFKDVLLYDATTEKFMPVQFKIGRRFVTLCFTNRVKFDYIASVTDGFNPVEVYRISEMNKCEVSNFTGNNDEFTIYLNRGVQLTFRSQDRLEILRYLYFTISRLPREPFSLNNELDYQNERHTMHWFGRLYNIVFQGLLSHDEELKSKAGVLFGSLSTYFEIDFGIRENHASNVPFPADATNFVVTVSAHLAKTFPQMTYRFFKAFFDNFDRIDRETRFTSILYLSPWIQNIYEYVFSNDENGADKTADLLRLFCRLTSIYKDRIPFINDYIWSKLFQEARLVSTLVEEVVAFAIDSKNDNPDWTFIIAVICPSIEVCGEVTSRLLQRINKVVTTDSSIALQSKLFEISVLIKICSSLFFNSYNLAKTYLAELIFFVTLFIDNPVLDVGEDLQKLLMTAIQSFLHKPNLTEAQRAEIDKAIAYFSTPRAKMIFGTSRDVTKRNDAAQAFNKITNIEQFADYLNVFIKAFALHGDRTNWRARWSSNTIDVAFNNYSVFQDRAFLMVGILSKEGISDSNACRTIKLVSNGELNSIDITICVAVAVARILDGLPDSSILPPILIWPQLCFTLLNHAVLYPSGLENVIASITKIMRLGPNYLDIIFEQQQYLEPDLSKFQERHGYIITKENFGVHIFFILGQGLRISQYRHLAIACIKRYFKQRYLMREGKTMDGKFITNNTYAYIFYLYLCCDAKEVEDYLKELEIDRSFISLDDNQKIPKLLIDLLFDNTEVSKILMIHVGFLFCDIQGVDISFKARFIQIYLYMLKNNRELALLVYHIIKPTLMHDLLNTVSVEVVKNISEIVEIVSQCTDYDPEYHKNVVDDILISKKITILKTLRHLKPLSETIDENQIFKPEFDSDIKPIQSMLYRAACSYISGSKLED
ncbi:hypothetical protein MEQ_01198 [Candida albicans P87]|nr:hypothetical protein MG1_01213 [Candida albicans GC75]KGU13478.1 hypothetical protein MEQ_01198 [Candida albicans P87]KHC74533.1 hypothetical protein MGI_01202 [Candida albicans P75016]